MRQIGTVTDQEGAERLCNYLLTLGIKTQWERLESGWLIWAIDEDRIAEARNEFNRFVQEPRAAHYLQADQSARVIQAAAARKEQQFRRQFVDVRSRWNHPLGGRPLTNILMALCIVVAFLTNFGERGTDLAERIFSDLSFCSYDYIPNGFIQWLPLSSSYSDIRCGQIWRLVSPIFLHGSPMHLFCNMMALNSLGGVLERRRGTLWLAFDTLILAVGSNFAQYVQSGPLFCGISGVVFGYFGFVWMKSRFDPSAGMYIDSRSVVMMLVFLVFCMMPMSTELIGPIANTAHVVGLLLGIVLGGAPIVWRRFVGRV